MAVSYRQSIYEPLAGDRIRLLVLEPGGGESELRCKLICGSLNDYYFPYEALSYAWGDQSDVIEVVCNEISINITRNLHDALMAIRLADSTRTIWVDALCINQTDVKERNHQVQLMANIYSGATKVIVWLGEIDASTRSVLELITCCARLFDLKVNVADRPDVETTPSHLSHGLLPLTDPDWRSLGKFLLRPWFKRAWVVQEVALANEVIFHCGNITMPWEKVLKAMLGIFSMDLGDLVANGNESIICLHFYQKAYALSQTYLAGKNEILRLEVLLFAEGARLASDDRDKVFALLGLANDVQSSNNPSGMPILADYEKSAAEVYIETTRIIIKHYRTLTILAAAGIPLQPGNHRVPSWVCDRSLKPRSNVFMSPAAKQQFSACRARANCRFTPEGNGLVVTGITHDIISIIGHPYSSRDFEESVVLQWGEIGGMHKTPVDSHKIDAFRITLVGNFGQDGPLTDFELESFIPWYENLQFRHQSKQFAVLSGESPVSHVSHHDEDRMIRRFSALVHRASGWRSFFLTKGGLMGIGPASAAAGDLICIVEGATVPLVLRKQDGEGDTCNFRFVGESYVHGLMGGEGYRKDVLRELVIY